MEGEGEEEEGVRKGKDGGDGMSLTPRDEKIPA